MRTPSFKNIFLLVLLTVAYGTLQAQQGSIDLSFNPGTGFNGDVKAVALQPDGRILVAGNFTTFNGTARNRVARLNANGTLDATFSVGTGFDSIVKAIAIQPDGKIVFGGCFHNYNGTSRNRLIRLNDNGTVDNTFNAGSTLSDTVHAVILQPDGKVLVGTKGVRRFNADGSVDGGFDTSTTTTTWSIRCLAIDQVGKILIGGELGWYTSYWNWGGVFKRLNTNGTMDTTFVSNGTADPNVNTMVFQPDGKLLLGRNIRMERRLYNLSIDNSFGMAVGDSLYGTSSVRAIAVQPDGKILVGGEFQHFGAWWIGYPTNRFVRLKSNGMVDSSFVIGTGFDSSVNSIALQPDGKIIIGGVFKTFNGTSRAGIVRINGSPLIAGINGNAYMCHGDTTTLTAYTTASTGTLSYQWSPATGLNCTTCSTVKANPTVTTTYTLIISDNNSKDTLTRTITIDTIPLSVSISTLSSTVCAHANTVFTASAPNAGNSVVYQWKRNSSNVGGNLPTYIDNTLLDLDTIKVLITSSRACLINTDAVSSSLIMAVKSAPGTVMLTDTGNGCMGTSALALTMQDGKTVNQIQWSLNNSPLDTASYPNITVAGGVRGQAANQLFRPTGIMVDKLGNMYVVDAINFRVQKFAPGSTQGITVAGGNGHGSAANQLFSPDGICMDRSGNLYIGDVNNSRIQKWAPGATTGTTVAYGNISYGICIDASGNLYAADYNNSCVKKFTPGNTTGTIVIGNAGSGSAANQLKYPTSVAIDSSGNLYVADAGNCRVQKWAPGATSGTTVAGGNGNGCGYAANQVSVAMYLAVDAANNVYISETGIAARVQKWAPGASTGITVAGGNGIGSLPNQFRYQAGICVDSLGNIYIVDTENDRVQKYSKSVGIDSTHNTINAGIYTATAISSEGCASTSNPITINTCIATVDTVWPGDANHDGVANMYDALSLGLAYADTGNARINATNVWMGQSCTGWDTFYSNGVNHDHADCNGNGTVDANDTVPILLNYGLTHSKATGQRTPGAAPLYLQLANGPVNAGDTAKFNILLGDNAIPANNIYGIAFSIQYDNTVLQANTLQQQFLNSWIGAVSNELLTLSKPLPGQSQLDLAVTRIDHHTRSGSGVIGQLSVITIDNISGKDTIVYGNLIFNIVGVQAINELGQEIPVDAKTDTFTIFHHEEVSGINDIATEVSVQLYPNPASHTINLVSSQAINSYVIYSPQGLEIARRENVDSKQSAIDISSFSQGIYLLQLDAKGQRITQRFTVIK